MSSLSHKEALIIEVEGVVVQRGDTPVPANLIAQAIDLINLGVEQVARYPDGKPSLRAVYKIAWRIFKETHE